MKQGGQDVPMRVASGVPPGILFNEAAAGREEFCSRFIPGGVDGFVADGVKPGTLPP